MSDKDHDSDWEHDESHVEFENLLESELPDEERQTHNDRQVYFHNLSEAFPIFRNSYTRHNYKHHICELFGG